MKPTKRGKVEKVLTPEQEAIHKKVADQERERHNAHVRKFCPPGRKFYCYANSNDSQWPRYDTLPTLEEVEEHKALKWSGGMIGSASSSLGGFVLTGIHHDSRVIEFEYVLETDEDGRVNTYAPWF